MLLEFKFINIRLIFSGTTFSLNQLIFSGTTFRLKAVQILI